MTTTRVFTNSKESYKKGDGVTVNSSGKLYFREPGNNTTTLKAVYANKELTSQLVNPVILDSGGRAPEIFLSGDYNVQHTDSDDVQIWRVNNYQPPQVDGQFDAWDSSLTYAVNDYVRDSNGLYYVSLSSGNTGNVPSTSPTYWSQAFFFTVYNSTDTYAINEVVYYEGNIYTSLQNSNTGNTPDTSFTFWRRPGISVPPITDYQGQIIKYVRTATLGAINLGSFLSTGVSESFGPTGSGADNIWSDMDDIPLNAVSMTLEVEATATKTTSTSALYGLTAVFNGEGTTLQVKGANLLDYGSSTEPSASASTCVIDVPLSAANVFECLYTLNGTDTDSLFAKIIGFSVSEA